MLAAKRVNIKKKLRTTSGRRLSGAEIIIIGFALLIVVGALLLMLPAASRERVFTSPVKAFFTSVSATCVTGLTVLPTGAYWSLFGQIVIIVLIQIGGLGFMTLAVMLSVFIKRQITPRERLVASQALGMNAACGMVRLVKRILRGTALIEGVGAVILSVRFVPVFGPAKGIWYGVFHSVSAFCNAGFDLLGTEGEFSSLASYNGNPVVLLTIMALITIGGLGFFVWEDILRCGRDLRRLSLYSKMVLSFTAALILGGGLFFLLAEWDNPATLGDMPGWKRVLNAAFQAVTLRTAGFDTIGQGNLRDSSLAMSCILMLIGGSSGSTAGGLKTVTVGVLFLTLRAGLAGREEVTLRGRSISHRRVMNALTLTLIVAVIFLAGSMIISLVDDVPFLSAAFESASAMATVGVTVGITPTLSLFSHVLLICMMFLGRVGIMSFSIAFLARSKYPAKIKYPTMDIMIG